VEKWQERRDGSQGAASGVRKIDPATYQLPETKISIARPPTSEFVDKGVRWALERKADRLLKRTGSRGDAMLTRKDLRRGWEAGNDRHRHRP
jgi:hypothetical protein